MYSYVRRALHFNLPSLLTKELLPQEETHLAEH